MLRLEDSGSASVKDGMLNFAKWIDQFCPPDGSSQPHFFDEAVLKIHIDGRQTHSPEPALKPLAPRKVYMTQKINGGLIRPWQVGWRSDFGISGMVDPEVANNLIEIYLQEG